MTKNSTFIGLSDHMKKKKARVLKSGLDRSGASRVQEGRFIWHVVGVLAT